MDEQGRSQGAPMPCLPEVSRLSGQWAPPAGRPLWRTAYEKISGRRQTVECTVEAYHGKGISSLKRSWLRISIASDATMNMNEPLGLRRLILEAVSPSCGLFMPPTGP